MLFRTDRNFLAAETIENFGRSQYFFPIIPEKKKIQASLPSENLEAHRCQSIRDGASLLFIFGYLSYTGK